MEKKRFLWHTILMLKKKPLHTIYETLNEGKTILKDAKIESFDIDSRVLLSYVLGVEHHDLIANPKTEISNKFYKQYLNLIKRRSKHEPIAQITGEKEFWSLPFKICKDTLIPRPDSETIIQAVKTEFKDTDGNYKILDMGTGSGCLLLSLLTEYKNAFGIGIDIKRNAIKTAKENAKKLSLHTRSKILNLNWHDKKRTQRLGNIKFHIIVSNPPYITAHEMEELEEDVKKYEPRLALYGGRDGLDEYRYISKVIYYWDILEKNGKIFLELGKGQHNDVQKIFEAFGFKYIKNFKDLNGIVRVIEFSKK